MACPECNGQGKSIGVCPTCVPRELWCPKCNGNGCGVCGNSGLRSEYTDNFNTKLRCEGDLD